MFDQDIDWQDVTQTQQEEETAQEGEWEDEEKDWDSEINQIGFPMLFYGVEGRDVCDDESPSFYNPIEVRLPI